MAEVQTTTAAVVLIGDEILSGKVLDENAAFLIGELRLLGVALKRIAVIPDVVAEIAETVRDCARRFDHVFTSGGVGPTHDDLTMEGVARAFDTEVTRHPQLEELLRMHYRERLQERNLRMADVPRGATLIACDLSWPAIAMRNVYVLPGIPALFRKKFLAMRDQFRCSPYHLCTVLSLVEEGAIASSLDQVVRDFPGVQVGSYPTWNQPEYKVKVTLESKDSALVESATRTLIDLLGDDVFLATV